MIQNQQGPVPEIPLKNDPKNSGGNCPNQKNQLKIDPIKSGFIPCELLLKDKRRHRSGNQHTCPCQLWPCHSPLRLPMRGIHSHRFHMRYIYCCQRQLPTRSLHRIYWGKGKKGFRFCQFSKTKKNPGILAVQQVKVAQKLYNIFPVGSGKFLRSKIISEGEEHRSCHK